MVIDDTGSVEDIHAFIYYTKWRSGQVLLMTDSLTDSLLKDRATQLLIKYKSGALVTQYVHTVKLCVCFLFSSKKFQFPTAVCESSRINQENQNRSPPSPHLHFARKSNFFLSAHPPENNSICSSKTYNNYHQIQLCIL